MLTPEEFKEFKDRLLELRLLSFPTSKKQVRAYQKASYAFYRKKTPIRHTLGDTMAVQDAVAQQLISEHGWIRVGLDLVHPTLVQQTLALEHELKCGAYASPALWTRFKAWKAEVVGWRTATRKPALPLP